MPNKLPQGWVECQLDEVFNIVNGDRGKNYPAKNKLHASGIPFVSAINIQNSKLFIENLLYLSEQQYDLLRSGKINKGDTLLCIRGSIGKHCIYPFDKGAIASSMVIIRKILPNIDKFLFYYLESFYFRQEVKKYDNGTAQPNLSASDLKRFNYLLPPLNEQKRIVEKIESEFAKIDEGLEHLQQAKEQIKQYRQSVLKSAFEGKLYKTSEWEIFNILELCSIINGTTIDKSLEKQFGEIPYIKVSDMNLPANSVKITTSSRFVNKNEIKANTIIPENSIIFPKRGGAIATNKKRKVIFPIIIDLNIMALIPNNTNILSHEYLYYWLQKLDLSTISNGGAVPQINRYSFENLFLKLPTLEEQKRIVEEIKKRFAVADEVEKVVEDNIEKAKQLKQSILKKAFEGRLVPQDPTDEPASKLLEKIKQERYKNDRK